jgi:uncharacterized membrane protein YhaH (DUF805 family)
MRIRPGKLFSFSGRAPRAAFWLTSIAIGAVFVVLFVFLETAFGRPSTLILYPFFFWLAAATAVRRLHDRGRSAWFLLILIIPILGPIWLLIELAFRAGTEGDNQYGPDPYARTDYLVVR